MKKLRTLATLASVAILSILPMTAYADTVDDICDEYGYDYRWTIEAELDDTYSGSWVEEISNDGKIRISYVSGEKAMNSKYFDDLLIIEGNETVYFGMDTTSYKDIDGTYVSGEVAPNGDKWESRTGRNKPKVYIYGSGESKYENRFIYISALAGFKSSPITLRNQYMDKVEDTEMSLAERTDKLYAWNKANKSPDTLSKGGKYKVGTLIDAKPIVRADKKTPIVDDDYFLQDDERDDEEKEVTYAKKQEIPNFNITLEKARKMVERNIDEDVKELADDIGYSKIILNGRVGNSVIRSVPGGKAKFTITLPKEKTEGISSTGKVDVVMQAFDKYDASMLDEPMKADDLLNFKPAGSQEYWEVYEIVVTVKGDLGEQAYLIDSMGKEYREDGAYSTQYELYKILKMDDEVIIYQSARREPYQEDVKGAFVDKNEEYMYFKLEENFLRCEYSDSSYCGIERIGFQLGDDTCMINLDKTKTDFWLELDLSSNVISRDATRKLLSEIRAERTKNNEVVNTLETGKANIKVDVKPEDKKQEEIKDEEDEKEEKPEILPVPNGEIRVDLKGKFLEFIDQKPIIENDRVLVPFRVIFEALEADVKWDGETKTVTATKGDITITLTIGENKITKNGKAIEVDVPAQIKNERTMVPIRVVLEAFENTVNWDKDNRIVGIK